MTDKTAPNPETITKVIDHIGDFLHGVSYNTTFTSSQRTFSDIMRTRPLTLAETLGRSISGAALAIASATVQKSKH